MKKLIILAGVAFAMVAANAAAMKWQVNGVKTPGSDGSQSGTTINSSTAGVTISLWALTAAIEGDVWSAVAEKDKQGYYTVNKPAGASDTTASWKSSTGTFTDPGSYNVKDTAYGAVVLLYDANSDGKIGAGDYYMALQSSYKFEAASNKTLALANSSSGNWTKITGSTPTPEPTSGLLLLLGMAGLALRRRRA